MNGTATGQAAMRLLAPAVTFVLLGLLWQVIAFNQRSILPPLDAVASDLAARPGFYLSNLWVTMYAALVGFALGALLAVLLAVTVIHFAFLRAAVVPVALLLNVTPIVAISPALIVAFGFNAVPHIIVAAVAAFFPMLINAMAGLQAIDPQALEVFRSMAAPRRDIFFRLRLPSSLQFLFSGAKLAITAAMVGAIVSEFMGTSHGIGATIVMATTYLNLKQMWGAIFVSALSTLALVGLVGLVEKATIRW
ncbi:MAG TPA: ABC transporter permease subunit [Steroidobacteraceae bacterium]|jgi:NitT/TauT family transport system permease protein